MSSAIVKQSCGWCDELNVMTGKAVFCWRCGHRGDVPRMQCDCEDCQARLKLLNWTGDDSEGCGERCPECHLRCVGIREHVEETRESGADLHSCVLAHVWHHGAEAIKKLIH
jgi:hypothetical protein